MRKRRQEVGVEERNGDNKRVAICTKEEEEGVEKLEEERRGEERTGQVREKESRRKMRDRGKGRREQREGRKVSRRKIRGWRRGGGEKERVVIQY